MPRMNLTSMDVQSLMSLRARIDETLKDRRRELEKQLLDLGAAADGARVGRGRRGVSALKGRKVPAKYRGPSGETWAGRGAQPRWLAEAIEAGQSPEDFLIEKPRAVAKKRKKKRRAKK
jgi:DNA-binding protein H-NS